MAGQPRWVEPRFWADLNVDFPPMHATVNPFRRLNFCGHGQPGQPFGLMAWTRLEDYFPRQPGLFQAVKSFYNS